MAHTAATEHHDEHSNHGDGIGTYLAVFATLMVLLIVTVWVSFHHFGVFNPIIAVTIALIKAALVIWFFMHVRHGSHLTWVFAGVGFFFLGILIFFTMADYTSRGWRDSTGRELTQQQTMPGPFESLMKQPDTPSGPSK